jgi:hypothetical protein
MTPARKPCWKPSSRKNSKRAAMCGPGKSNPWM